MRIAQLTDLHLRQHQPGSSGVPSRHSRQMATLLPKALEQIQKQPVDLLALTGDLLDAPLWMYEPARGFEIDEIEPWNQAVLADYRLLKQQLDESGLRYTVLPGNHDLEPLMWQVFDPDENVFDLAGHRIVRFCDREFTCHMPRRFGDQRRLWDAALADPQSPPQIHLQHYVLTPCLNQGYPHTYAEGEDLVQRIVASGRVRFCLSGHYHKGTPLSRIGDTFFTAGPTFAEPPFAWRVYDVSADGVTMAEHSLGREAVGTRPVVFLDRDGVINDLESYQYGPERMNLLPGVGAAIRRLREAGYAIVVVTNQSCVGMGYVPEVVVLSVLDKMCRLLAQEGADIDTIYYPTAAGERAVLPAYRDTRECKPNPTVLLEAARDLNLDLTRSWMVGDNVLDVTTAMNAGVKPILVRTGAGQRYESQCRATHPQVTVVNDLVKAAEVILGAGGSLG